MMAERRRAIDYIRARNFGILDCECIQTSSHHQCVRSLFILCKDGFTSKHAEFYACIQYRELDIKYKKAFRYCQKHIHHLQYKPQKINAPLCIQAAFLIQEFVRMNNIDIILFKGGTIEQRLCNDAGVPSLNIEILGAPKVNSHDPKVEVHSHYNYLLNIGCLFPLPNNNNEEVQYN